MKYEEIKIEYVNSINDIIEKANNFSDIKNLNDYIQDSISKYEELIRTYQNSDLLILPSINNNEAFGIVLIEAMACKLAVLSSDLAGVRSVFEDGKQGLVFKTGNNDDLKSKIEYLLSNRQVLNKMGEEARIICEKKYSLEKMKLEINKLFVWK